MSKPPSTDAAWLACMSAGRKSYQKKHYGDALRAFKQATRLLPERVEGWINLGSSLLEAGHFNAAAKTLNTAIVLNPNTMVSHMLMGDAMRMLGRQGASLKHYKNAVSLQRAPMALNKLACALRARHQVEEAQELYLEALRIAPTFSLAQVNLATLQVQRNQYEEAETQLAALRQANLPAAERQEVESTLSALAEYSRLSGAITTMNDSGDCSELLVRLEETPVENLEVDRASTQTLQDHLEFARQNPDPEALDIVELPQEWPLIEAMHMIPLVHSVDEYRSASNGAFPGAATAQQILQSTNMEAAIHAARNSREDLQDPVKAELHLRHWHGLACNGVEGLLAGHFKYTQNASARSATLPRVDPALASGTMRYIISEINKQVPPGLNRAAIVLLGLTDPHPFADGNGRVGMTWLNRELEWAGLMPALFSNELGYKGELGTAVVQVRTNGGDLTPLLEVLRRAQQHARAFLQELAGHPG